MYVSEADINFETNSQDTGMRTKMIPGRDRNIIQNSSSDSDWVRDDIMIDEEESITSTSKSAKQKMEKIEYKREMKISPIYLKFKEDCFGMREITKPNISKSNTASTKIMVPESTKRKSMISGKTTKIPDLQNKGYHTFKTEDENS